MKLSNRLTRNNPVKPSRSSKRPTDLPRDDMYRPSVHQSFAWAVLMSLLLLESFVNPVSVILERSDDQMTENVCESKN